MHKSTETEKWRTRRSTKRSIVWIARLVAGFQRYSVYTHFPKDPKCDICLKMKITMASCRRRAGTVVPKADNFGDFITADHKILSEESESRSNYRYAVVVQDLASQWLQSYPCKQQLPRRPRRSPVKFLARGPKSQEPRAEDALAESYLVQKFLVIWL